MKFIVDFMLGRLCKWLRLMGYDAVFFRGADKNELIYESLKQRRVVLTRNARITDKKVLKRVLVKSDDLNLQIRQLVEELGLTIYREKVFSRCIVCNSAIEEAARETVKDRVPAYVFQTREKFFRCPGCDRVYWKGTHWDLVNRKLEGLQQR